MESIKRTCLEKERDLNQKGRSTVTATHRVDGKQLKLFFRAIKKNANHVPRFSTKKILQS